MDAEATVRKLTALLRSGAEPFWIRLRELIRGRDLDPDAIALAISHEDDEAFEFGVLVLPDGTAIQFGVSYLDVPIEEAQFSEWEPLRESYASGMYAAEVNAARVLLGAA